MKRAQGLVKEVLGLSLLTGIAGTTSSCCMQFQMPDSVVMQMIEEEKRPYFGGIENFGAVGCLVSSMTENIGEVLNLAYNPTVGNNGKHVLPLQIAERNNVPVYMMGHSAGGLETVFAARKSKANIDILFLIDPTYTRNRWMGKGLFYQKIPATVRQVYCLRNTGDIDDFLRGDALEDTDLEDARYTKYQNLRFDETHLGMVNSPEVERFILEKIRDDMYQNN